MAIVQPRKVEHAVLSCTVDRHVLIYIHKEQALDDAERRYWASIMSSWGRLQILAAVKQLPGERVTTASPHQWDYAREPKVLGAFPPADVPLERIGDLRGGNPQLLTAWRLPLFSLEAKL